MQELDKSLNQHLCASASQVGLSQSRSLGSDLGEDSPDVLGGIKTGKGGQRGTHQWAGYLLLGTTRAQSRRGPPGEAARASLSTAPPSKEAGGLPCVGMVFTLLLTGHHSEAWGRESQQPAVSLWHSTELWIPRGPPRSATTQLPHLQNRPNDQAYLLSMLEGEWIIRKVL